MDFRTISLGVGVFCATFVVGWWLNIGGLAAGMRPAPAEAAATEVGATENPSATVGQRVAVQTPPTKPPPASNWSGPGLAKDKLMRDLVVSAAEKYQNPPCNQDVAWLYRKATTEYAETLLRAAGCQSHRCPMSNGQLERIWQERRSALDRPVALAMADAHSVGGLNERHFPGDVGRAVQVMAGRYFEPGPPPACSNRSTTTRNWNVRIRRR